MQGVQVENYRFTIKQHVFPVKSIEQHYSRKNVVQLFDKRRQSLFPAKSNNNLFTVNRVWDERAEKHIGKPIEDEFQRLTSRILAGKIKRLGIFESELVSRFWSLWRTRNFFKVEGLPDVRAKGITGDSLTEQQRIALEAKGVMYVGDDGVMPGRFLAGIHIVRFFDSLMTDQPNTTWGIVHTSEGELIVPDTFGENMVVPLTPKVLLIANAPDCHLTPDELALINREAICSAQDFYFARNFSQCPVITSARPPFRMTRPGDINNQVR